jgi:hypothetical protein
MKNFIAKNWVFISGLLASLTVTLQQFIGQSEISWKAIGFAVLMTVLSYAANQWKGKGISFTGIIGTLSGVFITVQQTGAFNWNQFVLYSLVAILAAASPNPQPATKQ